MYAALKANSTTFQKRELRVTRLKPPSAQKGARPGLKSSGQNRPTSKAQGAQRRMQQGIVPSRESWQGTRTKGPSKVNSQEVLTLLSHRCTCTQLYVVSW